jgi:hypothetical protein
MFMRGAHRLFRVPVILLAFSEWIAPGEPNRLPRVAPDGGGPPPQYAIRQWTSADGLPASTIQCLLQTHDGYLWIGTRNGLVRFNGRDFRTFPGINCRSLAEDSDGILWIGGSESLVRWNGTDLKGFRLWRSTPPHIPQQVLSLCPSREGGVWVGWEGELWRARGEKLWRILRVETQDLCESHAGPLYLAATDFLGTLVSTDPPGSPPGVPVLSPHDATRVVESPDGAIWFVGRALGTRLRRWKDGQTTEYAQDVGMVLSIASEPCGLIWLGTPSGLWQVRGDRIARPQGVECEAFGVINCLLPDREGNLWVGTEHNGLYCLRRRPFVTYTTRDGLVSDDIWSIVQATTAASGSVPRVASVTWWTGNSPTSVSMAACSRTKPRSTRSMSSAKTHPERFGPADSVGSSAFPARNLSIGHRAPAIPSHRFVRTVVVGTG